jgi:hypothetical protein
MIGFLFIVEMANPGDMRRMAVTLRPFDCLVLRFEGSECVVGVIFDYIVVNAGTYGMALWSSLNVNDRHGHISLLAPTEVIYRRGKMTSSRGRFAPPLVSKRNNRLNAHFLIRHADEYPTV